MSLDRVPVPLPLLGLSESISADQQEPGTTARALNVRGVDPRSPGRIRLAQRSGLAKHGKGTLVAAGSPVVTMFQGVKDTPPEAWGERTTISATEWSTAVTGKPIASETGTDGNSYTLLDNGSVVIVSERGKLLGTIDVQAPVGFRLISALGVDEDGAVYTMAAFGRRIDGGAGRLYRHRKSGDFWGQESEFVFDWVPRTFVYDRGEILVTASRPDDWDVDPEADGPAPFERLYRIGGAKGGPFVVWYESAAHPAVSISSNTKGDIFVASPRNPDRQVSGTPAATPSVGWVPREATTGAEGQEASESLYMHLSAIRAQNVQGLTNGATSEYWRGGTDDPSDFGKVIDSPARDLIAALDRLPTFDTNGMIGAPGFTFNGQQLYHTLESTGHAEKETVDSTAQHCRSVFPNMRDASGAGARFSVSMLFRVDTVADAQIRYVFEQGNYSLRYFDDGTGNLDFTFTFPGGSQLLDWGGAKGLTGATYVFTFVHDGHGGGSADVYLSCAGTLLSFTVLAANINQAQEFTSIGGPAEMTAPSWGPLTTPVIQAGKLVWDGGALWTCTADHIKANADRPSAGGASWTAYTAKSGMSGAIAEIVTFLGASSASTAPHDTLVGSTLWQKVEGFIAWAYGAQAAFPVGHPYDAAAAAPAGTGDPGRWTEVGGLNVAQGLTAKYSRQDGRVIWVENLAGNGNAVVSAKDDYLYVATVEPVTSARVRKFKDEGETTRLTGTDVWTVPDSAGNAWLGDTVRITADHCGDLYVPWVDSEGATARTVRRYKFEGNGLGGPSQTFSYELGSDAYAVKMTMGGLAVDESATGGACGPEFVYVPTVDPSPPEAPTYSVRRIDVLERTATGSTNPRQITLLAVTEDGTVSRYTGSAWASVAATVLPGAYVWKATLFSKTFLGNGKAYRVYDHATGGVRNFEESTTGRIPPRCRLGCAWRGRMVLARGDSAHDWFMSATADPFDWEFVPDVVTETQAVSGSSSQVGEVPDIVNALVPWSDDLLLFGCDSSIWRLTGDPMASGELHRVSDITGMAFGDSWCKDPEQRIYFWGSRGGLYSATPDGGVVPLSEGRIHRRLQDIDLGAYTPRLVWNDVDVGVHVFLVSVDGKGEPYHYFWERKTGAFWADRFHGPNLQVRGVYLSDGDATNDRQLLLGGADGYVRRWSPDATDDDGEQIRATCLIGPLTPDTQSVEARVVAVEAVLARDQGGCSVAVMGTREADVPYMAESSAPLSPGRNGYTRMRAKGAHIWVEFSSSETGQSFAVEDLAIHMAPSGRKR